MIFLENKNLCSHIINKNTNTNEIGSEKHNALNAYCNTISILFIELNVNAGEGKYTVAIQNKSSIMSCRYVLVCNKLSKTRLKTVYTF